MIFTIEAGRTATARNRVTRAGATLHFAANAGARSRVTVHQQTLPDA